MTIETDELTFNILLLCHKHKRRSNSGALSFTDSDGQNLTLKINWKRKSDCEEYVKEISKLIKRKEAGEFILKHGDSVRILPVSDGLYVNNFFISNDILNNIGETL
jgi:hypothetical protein